MRSGFFRRIPVVLLQVGCAALLAMSASRASGGQDGASNAKQSHVALLDIPEKYRARPNPMEGELDSVAAGGKLYELHCAECHGRKAEGTRRAPSLMRQAVQQAAPGAIFYVLTNGVVRRGMPVWSKLPEPQRWQIVTFLKSLRAERNSIPGER